MPPPSLGAATVQRIATAIWIGTNGSGEQTDSVASVVLHFGEGKAAEFVGGWRGEMKCVRRRRERKREGRGGEGALH